MSEDLTAWKIRAEAAENQRVALQQALEHVLERRCWCAPHPETRVLGHDATHCEGFIALASAKAPDWRSEALESLRERCAMVLMDPTARQHYVLMGPRAFVTCADRIRALPLLVEGEP